MTVRSQICRRRAAAVAGAGLCAVLLAAPAAAPAAPARAAAAAALGPARLGGGLVRISPEIPIVGSRVTLEVRLPGGSAPRGATAELTSPTGVRLRARLVRVGPSLLRGTTHFGDDGLWRLSVRAAGVDAYGEVLVLQNGGLYPPPRLLPTPVPVPGGGLGLLAGR